MTLTGRRPFALEPGFERLTLDGTKLTVALPTTKPVILLGSGSGRRPAPALLMNGDMIGDWGLAPISPAPGWKGLGRPKRLEEALLSLLTMPMLPLLLLLLLLLTLTLMLLLLLLLLLLVLLLMLLCILTLGLDCDADADFVGLDAWKELPRFLGRYKTLSVSQPLPRSDCPRPDLFRL